MHIDTHVKYPLFLSDFNKKAWILWTDFQTKSLNIQLHEIRPVRDEFFYAEGRTERQTDGQTSESNNRFSQFFERA